MYSPAKTSSIKHSPRISLSHTILSITPSFCLQVQRQGLAQSTLQSYVLGRGARRNCGGAAALREQPQTTVWRNDRLGLSVALLRRHLALLISAPSSPRPSRLLRPRGRSIQPVRRRSVSRKDRIREGWITPRGTKSKICTRDGR